MSLACTCRNPVCGIDRHSVSCVAHIIVFAALGVIVQDMVQSCIEPLLLGGAHLDCTVHKGTVDKKVSYLCTPSLSLLKILFP